MYSKSRLTRPARTAVWINMVMQHFVARVDQSVTISSKLRPVSAEIFFMYCQASITDKAVDVRLGEVKSRNAALCSVYERSGFDSVS